MGAPKGGGPEGWEPRRVGAPKGGGPEGWGPRRVGAPKGGGPQGWGARRVGGPNTERWGPKGWGTEGWGTQNFTLFLPFPATVSLFLCLSGCLLVEFWWCLKRRGPEMCTFGVLGLSCASPGGPVWWGRRGFTRQPESPKVPGFHTTTREPKRAHLSVPVFKNTTKIQREDPQREKKE